MRGGRAGIATPRAASVSRCMRCAVWSGRVPRGPRWTGPTALAIYPRGGVPRNVVARSASAISAAGGRGVRRVRRKRAGADTRGAQLWTPGGDGTSASGAGAMGSFKYKWEDLQKLVLLTFNNTTAAVSPPAPPLRCPAPLPCRGHRTSPGCSSKDPPLSRPTGAAGGGLSGRREGASDGRRVGARPRIESPWPLRRVLHCR